jgi:hypothetical protein
MIALSADTVANSFNPTNNFFLLLLLLPLLDAEEVYLYQMKEDEHAFLNTMKPATRKYGLGYKKLEELDSSYIFAKDLTRDWLKDTQLIQ